MKRIDQALQNQSLSKEFKENNWLSLSIEEKQHISTNLKKVFLFSPTSNRWWNQDDPLFGEYNKKFSKFKTNKSTDTKQVTINLNINLNDSEIKKFSEERFVKNFSVKKGKDSNEVSALAIFSDDKEKDNFLEQWSSKIKSYDVSLDEIN